MAAGRRCILRDFRRDVPSGPVRRVLRNPRQVTDRTAGQRSRRTGIRAVLCPHVGRFRLDGAQAGNQRNRGDSRAHAGRPDRRGLPRGNSDTPAWTDRVPRGDAHPPTRGPRARYRPVGTGPTRGAHEGTRSDRRRDRASRGRRCRIGRPGSGQGEDRGNPPRSGRHPGRFRPRSRRVRRPEPRSPATPPRSGRRPGRRSGRGVRWRRSHR